MFKLSSLTYKSDSRTLRDGTSTVGRALDCRAGGRGFDSRGGTNTQILKITEK